MTPAAASTPTRPRPMRPVGDLGTGLEAASAIVVWTVLGAVLWFGIIQLFDAFSPL